MADEGQAGETDEDSEARDGKAAKARATAETEKARAPGDYPSLSPLGFHRIANQAGQEALEAREPKYEEYERSLLRLGVRPVAVDLYQHVLSGTMSGFLRMPLVSTVPQPVVVYFVDARGSQASHRQLGDLSRPLSAVRIPIRQLRGLWQCAELAESLLICERTSRNTLTLFAPRTEDLQRLDRIVASYAFGGDLTQADLGHFVENRVQAAEDDGAAVRLTLGAWAWLMLHEICHSIPLDDANLDQHDLWSDVPELSPDRRARWNREVMADLFAVDRLCQVTSRALPRSVEGYFTAMESMNFVSWVLNIFTLAVRPGGARDFVNHYQDPRRGKRHLVDPRSESHPSWLDRATKAHNVALMLCPQLGRGAWQDRLSVISTVMREAARCYFSGDYFSPRRPALADTNIDWPRGSDQELSDDEADALVGALDTDDGVAPAALLLKRAIWNSKHVQSFCEGTVNPDGSIVLEPLQRDYEPNENEMSASLALEGVYAAAMPIIGQHYHAQLGVSLDAFFPEEERPSRVRQVVTFEGQLSAPAQIEGVTLISGIGRPPTEDASSPSSHFEVAVQLIFLKADLHEKINEALSSELMEKGITALGGYNPAYATAASFAKGFVRMVLESGKGYELWHVRLGVSARKVREEGVLRIYLLQVPRGTELTDESVLTKSSTGARGPLLLDGRSLLANYVVLTLVADPPKKDGEPKTQPEP